MADRAQYTPGLASGAQIQKEGQNWTLILVRELRHSAGKVWEALTGPAHRREWAPFDADGSLGAVGNKVKLTTVGAPTPRVTETIVTRADAPQMLEYKWGDFDMRWKLEALGGGTRLTLWTNLGHRFISMGAASTRLGNELRPGTSGRVIRKRKPAEPEFAASPTNCRDRDDAPGRQRLREPVNPPRFTPFALLYGTRRDIASLNMLPHILGHPVDMCKATGYS